MKIYLLCEVYEGNFEYFNTIFCSNNKKEILKNKIKFENDPRRSFNEDFFVLEYTFVDCSKFEEWLNLYQKSLKMDLNLKIQLFFDIKFENDRPYIKNILFNDDKVEWDNINLGGFDYPTYTEVDFFL